MEVPSKERGHRTGTCTLDQRSQQLSPPRGEESFPCRARKSSAEEGAAFIHSISSPQVLPLAQLLAQVQAVCFLCSPGQLLRKIWMCSK